MIVYFACRQKKNATPPLQNRFHCCYLFAPGKWRLSSVASLHIIAISIIDSARNLWYRCVIISGTNVRK